LGQKSPRTEKEEWQYQNMLLTVKSDSQLKEYLKNNLPEFRSVVILLSSGEKANLENAAKRLLLNFVKEENGRFELNIGGNHR
jgi:hypothetical protein